MAIGNYMLNHLRSLIDTANEIEQTGLVNLAGEVRRLTHELRNQMGIYNDNITKLEAATSALVATNAAQATQITSLTTQLAAATALEPDSSDIAAVQGIPAFIAGLPSTTPVAAPTAPVVAPSTAIGTSATPDAVAVATAT
jgi:hypothetical protein